MISLVAFIDTNRDKDSGKFLATLPAFPDVVGYADTEEESVEKVSRIFIDHVTAFLDLNGTEGFAEHLRATGFVAARHHYFLSRDIFEQRQPGRRSLGQKEPWSNVPEYILQQNVIHRACRVR